MIGGYEYAFEDMECAINGYPLVGFQDVEYGTNKVHENIPGRGNRPVAMSRGKKDSEPGRLVILQSEFEAIQRKSLRGTDPTDWAPFIMTVAYAPLGGIITVDKVPDCRVTRWKKGMSTEDGHMTIELELKTGLPQLNVA